MNSVSASNALALAGEKPLVGIVEQREVDRKWFSRNDTGFVTRTLDLGSPVVKRMFGRGYGPASQGLEFISVYAEFALRSKERSAELLKYIDNAINKAEKELGKLHGQLSKVLANDEVDEGEEELGYSQTLRWVVPVSNPSSMKLIRLFKTADEVHGMTLKGWVGEHFDHENKRQIEEEMKKILRTLLGSIRMLTGRAINAAAARRDGVSEEQRQDIAAAKDVLLQAPTGEPDHEDKLILEAGAAAEQDAGRLFDNVPAEEPAVTSTDGNLVANAAEESVAV